MTFEASILDVPLVDLACRDHLSWQDDFLGGADVSAVVANLTNANGTADGTIADVGGAFSQTTLNNNFRDISDKVNSLLTATLAATGLPIVGDKGWIPTVANNGTVLKNALAALSSQWAGSVRLGTSTTASGSAQIRLGYGSSSDSMSAVTSGDRIAMEWGIWIPAASTGAQEAVWKFGLLNNALNGGIWFEYDRNTSVNWRIKTADGTTTNSQTTSTAVATGQMVKCRMEGVYNNIEFFINDTLVGASVANIPIAGTVVYTPYANITKTAGSGTGRNFDIDWVRFRQVYATKR